jgi:hypothetical protein
MMVAAATVGILGFVGCAGEVGSPVDTTTQELSYKGPYLALGDSVAFGYNPVAAADPVAQKRISSFVGYPELIGLAGIREANASCEGETSGSFIDVRSPDNGCQAWRAAGNAMHVKYAGAAESQLEFALAYLAQHPDTKTVSLGIGANDLLLLQNDCTAAHQSDPENIPACIAAGAPATILGAAENVGYVLGAIRHAGYAGQLVVVTYYELEYSNTMDLNFQALYGLDEALVQVAQTPGLDASVAKAFTTFGALAELRGGDSCAAGLLYKLSDGTCDKHPSLLGHGVLAATVAAAAPASSIDLTQTPIQF